MSAAVASGVLKRDRLVVLSGLAAVTALAWTYMFYLDWNMSNMDMAMPLMQTWDVAYLVLTFIMWAVMMVAMMTPSATPMILTFAQLNRQRQMQQRPLIPTGMFLLGYLLIWVCFSVLATTSPILGGVLLMAAGVFQWTPLSTSAYLTVAPPWVSF